MRRLDKRIDEAEREVRSWRKVLAGVAGWYSGTRENAEQQYEYAVAELARLEGRLRELLSDDDDADRPAAVA